MSDFGSDPSSTSILHVCEQRRLWRDCADALVRLRTFAGQNHNLMSWLSFIVGMLNYASVIHQKYPSTH